MHVVVIQELHNNESVDWQQYCIELVFKLTLTKQIFNHLTNTIFINRNAYVLSLEIIVTVVLDIKSNYTRYDS